MADDFHVLVDSDAFVGWIWPNDAHHRRAGLIFDSLRGKHRRLVTTSLVVAETATVLSHRDGQAVARLFLDEVGAYPIIHIDETLHRQAIELFKAQDVKGTSLTDCANVVVMKRFGIPRIFSFDRVYFAQFSFKPAI